MAVASAPDEAAFDRELVALAPHLRAFGRALSHDAVLGDDLAQDTLAKALASRGSYTPGTNMRGWTYRILRNQFYSLKRRSWRSRPLDPEVAERALIFTSNPTARLELDELRRALNMLSPEHREVLILIGAGLSYEELVKVTGARLGAIKSRVSRARDRLALVLTQGAIDTDGEPAHTAMAAIFQEVEGYLAPRSPRRL